MQSVQCFAGLGSLVVVARARPLKKISMSLLAAKQSIWLSSSPYALGGRPLADDR